MITIGRSFYIYILCSQNGDPFYIGKGTNTDARRLYLRSKRRDHRNPAVVAKIGELRAALMSHVVRIVFESACEGEVFSEERRLIALFGRVVDGGILLNAHQGGAGGRRIGSVMTEDSKKKISASNKGRKRSPEFCAHMSEIQRGRKLSPGRCADISKAMLGRVVTDETREKISAAQRGRPRKKHSDATRAAMALSAVVGWQKRRERQNYNAE